MPLDRIPDTATSADEIDDPVLLVHRVLYRTGRIGDVFRDDEPTPLDERRNVVKRIAAANRLDLYRLEQLLDTRPAVA